MGSQEVCDHCGKEDGEIRLSNKDLIGIRCFNNNFPKEQETIDI